MRKPKGRLTLTKETLHLLEGRELSQAAGLTAAVCSATLACTVCTRCAGATCGNTC